MIVSNSYSYSVHDSTPFIYNHAFDYPVIIKQIIDINTYAKMAIGYTLFAHIQIFCAEQARVAP